jgi:hypothetical protein
VRVWNKHAEQAPDGAVYVGRPTKWGNPYVIGRDGTRDEVIEAYREWIGKRPELLAELRGKHLVCWCAPKACHADVLLELANEERNCMSETIKVAGFVEKIFERSGTNARGNWTAYSIKVQKEDGTVDPMYYQFGFEKPKFAEGDYITFDAVRKDDKAASYVDGSGKKPKNGPAKPPKPQAPAGGYNGPRKGGGGGGFKPREPVTSELFGKIGQNSTEDDIRRISLASARTAALEAVSVLLTHDGLVTSAANTKAGQAQRYDEIVAAIDKLTVKYFFDGASGRLLESVADEGSKTSRVAELPAEKPSKPAKAGKAAAADAPPADEDFDDSENLDQIGADDSDDESI